MHRYINCMAHNSSEGKLLIGGDHTAIVDCGMAFCAKNTIQNVKNALNCRALDYIFLTHTHYDHVGALPFFREQWPQIRLVTSEIGAAILLKETPRRVIREFSAAAAAKYGVLCDMTYPDDVFHADIIVKDKDIIELGGISAEVLETPGHTRDSLSYFIPQLALLLLNETPGVLLPDGNIYPCHLSGYGDAINSIKKCRQVPYEFLSLPHAWIAEKEITDNFFDRAFEVNVICRDFISDMLDQALSEEEMLALFTQKYSNETLSGFQPAEAFAANAKAMFACAMRERSA